MKEDHRLSAPAGIQVVNPRAGDFDKAFPHGLGLG
jgi:hypothetical protein